MIKHKPIPKTDVKIDGVVYKCNGQGIVELPKAYKQFNPIEEEIKKEKKKNVEQVKMVNKTTTTTNILD